MDSLTVLDHPVLSHKLAILRDENTRSPEFRKTLLEIGHIMSWPVFSHFSVAKTEITTPMEKTTQNVLTSPYPCIVSILRAGNGMADALSATLPEAPIGYIGMQRNANTHLAEPYFKKLPDQIQNRQIILVDPMLASGSSAEQAADFLKRDGAKNILFVCLVAAPEGIEYFHKNHPDIPIITAALDRELDENAYILPGLGDAGDRIYGTE
jgi:uracil phosphoribosyltransferase|tara:strand:- start:607 stop:1236 length:630 start_codon:yes stop_codon:yes gene_type:complete